MSAAQEMLLRSGELLKAVGGALEEGRVAASGSALSATDAASAARIVPDDRAPLNPEPAWLDLAACREYARGRIERVLGPEFAAADAFPTRVRLPDGPLLLCHRIMGVDAEPLSMTGGTLVTEHDVFADAWYLDGGRIPTCIAVEAGQADLFLSGYLGIDMHTRGLAVYRLLDAVVTFHDRLPEPGTVIRYVIRIDGFFQQGETRLFRFGFEATANGRRLITMERGCAGFFTQAELDSGKGVVRTELDKRPKPGRVTGGFEWPVALAAERYDEAALDALRRGDYAAAFGPAFAGLPLARPKALPGGMLRLVHRIESLEPGGGRYGLGVIRGEADIRPDDWFLTCHFVDDMVMPGTLMFECCMHTLRVLLMRAGWVGEEDELACEPVPGVASRLKCRGQVLASSRVVRYEIEVKEIGYGPDAYAVADALMYVDGKPIVEISDMSIRHVGVTKARIDALWAGRRSPDELSALPAAGDGQVAHAGRKPALYDYERILAFSTGKPSEAFGEPYRVFDGDSGRKIARLPRPPFQFLDRITALAAEPWAMVAGGEIEAEYDVPADAWYFASHGGGRDMPFAVLLEAALQPCGWYSAYMGSALMSEDDLCYRNLGGGAVQYADVTPQTGTLTTRVRATKVAQSGGMIIQSLDFRVTAGEVLVYEGSTMFGFFSADALARQVGLRGVQKPDLPALAAPLPYPEHPALARAPMLMVDEIVAFSTRGGKAGLGHAHGRKAVNPAEWFFEAHFYQDPVMPGSLGLETAQQLLAALAVEVVGCRAGERIEPIMLGLRHEWTYRGQVVPSNGAVDVYVEVTRVDAADRALVADALLCVDGLPIYEMKSFGVRVRG
jgi:3-hydroxymyristoyl/3-hydroxydecanoyl-(acyl carrier protein) dehydratase